MPTPRFTPERMARDLAFMQDPDKWPRYPALPLKLREGDFNDARFCGLLFDQRGPIVYFGNVHCIPDDIGSMERREYPTFEALAADYTVD